MPGRQTCNNCCAVYDTVQNVPLTGGSQLVPVWAPFRRIHSPTAYPVDRPDVVVDILI